MAPGLRQPWLSAKSSSFMWFSLSWWFSSSLLTARGLPLTMQLVDPDNAVAHCDDATENVVQFLQVSQAKASKGAAQPKPVVADADTTGRHDSAMRHAGVACAPLNNDGATFSVEVALGTSYGGNGGHLMKLVADTGSNALVVSSCGCNLKSHSGCPFIQECYAGPLSASFLLSSDDVVLSYGSGDLKCSIASDYAELAHTDISTYMREGLFLIRDRSALAISGDFQGILGLGIPQWPANSTEEDLDKLLLQEAGIDRYSVCFNYLRPGYLKMGVPPLASSSSLTSYGVFHWATGLQGIRAGSSTAPILTCSADMAKAGTETPCGMIPDSGTTQILGESSQVSVLLKGLCAEWPRCAAFAKNLGVAPSADVFDKVLSECSSWMTEDDGIHEVPSIFFDLVGANGQTKTVELTAWSYIVEVTSLRQVSLRSERVATTLLQASSNSSSGEEHRPSVMCMADIGSMEYHTKASGPVWILGEALFFQGTVSFDISSHPYNMEFDTVSSCDCSEGSRESPADLRATAGESRYDEVQSSRRQDGIRKVKGLPRRPNLDIKRPL